MSGKRVVLASLSAAMDGSFVAIVDVAGAMVSAGAGDDYRLIGGVAVMLHIQRLGLDLPLRATGDADFGVPPHVLRDPRLIREIEARGYEKVAGNRWEKRINERPVATVDLLVPSYTSRARDSARVGGVVTTEVPGLAVAFRRPAIPLDVELLLADGNTLQATVMLPDAVGMLALKAGVRAVRNESRDVEDLWRCLEIAAADGVTHAEFDAQPELASIREMCRAELGSEGRALSALTIGLQDDAAARRRTRVRALVSEVVGFQPETTGKTDDRRALTGLRPAMVKADAHRWEFKPRFRRSAFGWKSQPAIQRIKQAITEIKRVARADPVLGAEGAVILLERLSPALEHVDGSSGAIGTAVDNAITELVSMIARAPADPKTREGWLERLWKAHEADQIPYIERLTDHWGELCVSTEVASAWGDRLLEETRTALSPAKNPRRYFHGTSACLSALFSAERYAEILDLLETDTIWPYKRWAVNALVAMGKKSEALRYAESCRGPWTNDGEVDVICEEILLSSGLADEAYERYGVVVRRGGTYVATFRAVAKKYPHKEARVILADLVRTTPGDEGKWFAAAKEARLYDEALALASRTPCDPKTLTRAARDLAQKQPAFALGAGLLALHWLAQGYGYEITSADVWAAYSATLNAAELEGSVLETRARIRTLVETESAGGFVATILGKELGV